MNNVPSIKLCDNYHLMKSDPGDSWKYMSREIGARIKKLRENKGLSQDDLGHTSGKTGSYIGRLERWEKRYDNPTIETIFSIAKALECHPSLILFGEIMTPKKIIEEPDDKIGMLDENEKRLITDFRAIPRKPERESILEMTERFAKLFKRLAKK